MTSTLSASRRTRRVLGSGAAVLGFMVLVLVVLVVIGTAGRGDDETTVAYDPANHRPDGTSALAGILGRHGVDLRIVRGLADLTVTPRPGGDTTVVVTNPSWMTSATAPAVAGRIAGAHRIVVIAPERTTLDLLGLPIAEAFGPPLDATATARCARPGIAPDDVVTAGTGYHAGTETATCFGGDDGAQLVVVPADARLPETVVVSGPLTTNAELGRYDNAGVAVRTIAATDRVLWYQPILGETVPQSDDGDDPSVLPRFLGPLVFLAFFVVVALAVWRGRRFGPLAREPLPAVVKAIETTQARARLYRRAGIADRAAGTLRIHTLDRLADHLGLPYDPGRALDRLGADAAHPPDPAVLAIIAAVTSVTGRDGRQVADMLAGPPPTDDAALVTFTATLTALEKEVRRIP
ncbi:MAG: DUF4350 domain-containing protein [Gordonia sp. (in: high G+C Gram-positive bacteria)]